MKNFLNLLRKEKNFISFLIFIVIFIKFFSLVSGFSINMSSSITRGLYLLYPKYNIKKGDVINFKIPDSITKISLERNYLSKDIKTLTKYVVATENDVIERQNNRLFINGFFKGDIYLTDQKNKPLISVLKEGDKITLQSGDYFVLGIVENSLDSRYYGIVKEEDIEKKAILILKFK